MNDANLIAAGLLGLTLQWAKGPKKIPTWLAYVVFGALAVGVFVWQEPRAIAALQADWRTGVAMFAGFMVKIEGFSALWRKAKVAPRTDSI